MILIPFNSTLARLLLGCVACEASSCMPHAQIQKNAALIYAFGFDRIASTMKCYCFISFAFVIRTAFPFYYLIDTVRLESLARNE